ncbi:D-glycero-alpha-D-manno-heptose 1-phosphate guanylyltransferase [Fibrobacter sp. UWT3]|uniref:nucleotidyltransferase family protein n=1 Tax=Fibrobacter sp. UWT3 TaxID=1896225 RepID=UPI000BCD3FB4|nr:nucleotidyltransferase family protein [Fibrobacter sp. UWT3]SOE76613.1 D-glycero-alpha-D-manno-heptose 1-phosphate guanylyltransferase [Fibrobacter sp. UWT3]
MEVVILAGGLGTRLRSVVSEVPKCMAPVAGRPFLWYLLKYLTRFDVSRVILSVGYLREVIFKWVEENRGEFPFEFDYAVEEEPLGTGGGIRLALDRASSDSVFILNGDTFFDVDLNELSKQFFKCPKDIVIALKPMVDFDRYGSVDFDDCSASIVAFNEKKHCVKGLINGGVYLVSTRSNVFDGLPVKFSFETAVLEKQCLLGNVGGIVQDKYFIDIGIPEDYRKANVEFRALF